MAADPAGLQDEWDADSRRPSLAEAPPDGPPPRRRPEAARDGQHTEHLGFLLAEMQHLHRVPPGSDVVTPTRRTPDLRGRAALASVVDPEIPVITIEDLGILRDVAVGDDGRIEVTITPTYSGCPAMDVIRDDVERVLAEHGFGRRARVRTVLAPAWTTDWITDAGPPQAGRGRHRPARGGPGGRRRRSRIELVRCPQCGSADTRLVSRFGSTACKALRVCNRCLEPFDHFKRI